MTNRQATPWTETARAKYQAFQDMLPAVKQWRQEEQDAGRPSGLHDFFRTHGLCFECKTTGLDLSPIGGDAETPLYRQCDHCGGTGKIVTPEK